MDWALGFISCDSIPKLSAAWIGVRSALRRDSEIDRSMKPLLQLENRKGAWDAWRFGYMPWDFTEAGTGAVWALVSDFK